MFRFKKNLFLLSMVIFALFCLPLAAMKVNFHKRKSTNFKQKENTKIKRLKTCPKKDKSAVVQKDDLLVKRIKEKIVVVESESVQNQQSLFLNSQDPGQSISAELKVIQKSDPIFLSEPLVEDNISASGLTVVSRFAPVAQGTHEQISCSQELFSLEKLMPSVAEQESILQHLAVAEEFFEQKKIRLPLRLSQYPITEQDKYVYSTLTQLKALLETILIKLCEALPSLKKIPEIELSPSLMLAAKIDDDKDSGSLCIGIEAIKLFLSPPSLHSKYKRVDLFRALCWGIAHELGHLSDYEWRADVAKRLKLLTSTKDSSDFYSFFLLTGAFSLTQFLAIGLENFSGARILAGPVGALMIMILTDTLKHNAQQRLFEMHADKVALRLGGWFKVQDAECALTLHDQASYKILEAASSLIDKLPNDTMSALVSNFYHKCYFGLVKKIFKYSKGVFKNKFFDKIMCLFLDHPLTSERIAHLKTVDNLKL